ncbi:putative Mg2+ transporter-C (MgtC) family protein [Paenibacillus algorifonticola]|uniref:Putative Mg2+ transporter-C (MgtC) family protein n=1 Tax=Paenibacillus algorifonticola TaxID=684063 RepID=A0A1I2DGW8_9BACL|nr:MgtC/SapB family protein [Paenibacillus algorifonticola]SFE79764.1 putative Mg2+ transporter-C (MgtC) family protein [Paenibacillus algorifonticola]
MTNAVSSVWEISYYELTIRLLLAVVLGGLVGLEREFGGHSAGFRTHILVSLGSSTVVLLSMYGFAAFANEPRVNLDPARLAAQVISGIGFLGAGTILRKGNGISGLTTAASLWVVAAIGLSVGAGFYVAAAISTTLAVISLFVFNKLEKTFSRTKRIHEIRFKLAKHSSGLQDIVATFHEHGMKIHKLSILDDDDDSSEQMGGSKTMNVIIQVKFKGTSLFSDLTLVMASMDGVRGMEISGEPL